MSLREKLSPLLLESPPITTVDSSTFLSFLFQDCSTSIHFSSQLDLSWLTPAFDYLYQQKIAVDRYAGKEGQLREKYYPEETKRQAPAERNTIFYYDPDTNTYQICPAVHGDFTSVQSQLAEVGLSGKTPLIDFHSHPFDVLPSPIDYASLVLQSGTSLRFINVTAVLCPSMQILALATPQTPFLSGDEIITLASQLTTDLKSNPETTRLQQQEETIITTHFRRIGDLLNGMSQTLAQTIGGLQEVPSELSLQLQAAYSEQAKPLEQELADNLGPAHLALLNHNEKILNAALIRVARLWHIQLYFSTDRSQFIKFSA